MLLLVDWGWVWPSAAAAVVVHLAWSRSSLPGVEGEAASLQSDKMC